jgi:site-specific recombinase XerD
MTTSLPELKLQFLEYLEIERNVSQLTIRNYSHYLKRFLGFLAKRYPGSDQASDIDDEVIRNYRLFLSRYVDEHAVPLMRVTQGYHIIALRSFLKFLSKRHIKAVAPESLDIPKGESRSLKFLDREQMERLLSAPDNNRDKAILELLFSTGLRVSELVKLNRDDVNFKRREFGIIGKGGRNRVVFLSDSAIYWIQRYLEERTDTDSALFIRTSGRRDADLRLTVRTVQRIVEKYVLATGIPVKITPHGIRHTFATDLLSAGADLRAIQEMLGHKSVATTQIYTHITNPQLKKIHEKYHHKNKGGDI